MSQVDQPTTVNAGCRHKIATHRHGTKACYSLDGCRCPECAAARRRYERHRAQWLGEFPKTLPPRVDADPVRAHLASLMQEGMGPKRIAQVSGVPHGAVSKLIYGNYKGRPPSRTVTRRNANIMLALQLDLADGAKVPSTEAKRIVGELVARGWAKAEIGRRVTGPHAKALQAVESALVMAGTLRTLRRLLHEPVPARIHNVTGRLYQPNPDYQHQIIPATTRGVPEEFTPGSPVWLRVMRAGLKQAVEDSIRRHGRVAA